MLNKNNVAIGTAIIALVGVIGSAYVTTRSQQDSERQITILKNQLNENAKAEELRREQQKAVQKYAGPLSESAYELESRIFNILEQHFLDIYLTQGNSRQQPYALDNTVFVIAQYMAWTEIIHRDVQYIDLGQDEQTKKLVELQSDIQGLFLTDRKDFGPALMIFTGEQRALGELMIEEKTPRGPECIGYGSFLRELRELDNFNGGLLGFLISDVHTVAVQPCQSRPRLVCLQHALVDLYSFLDPQYLRFPPEHRWKVAPTGQEVDNWCRSPRFPAPTALSCGNDSHAKARVDDLSPQARDN